MLCLPTTAAAIIRAVSLSLGSEAARELAVSIRPESGNGLERLEDRLAHQEDVAWQRIARERATTRTFAVQYDERGRPMLSFWQYGSPSINNVPEEVTYDN